MALFKNILWKFRCPTSVDDIAANFVDAHISKEQKTKYDFDAAHIERADPWFAYRRRIAAIYGVASTYKPAENKPSKRGWNRGLWSKHENKTPDELVEAIFNTVLERLKRLN